MYAHTLCPSAIHQMRWCCTVNRWRGTLKKPLTTAEAGCPWFGILSGTREPLSWGFAPKSHGLKEALQALSSNCHGPQATPTTAAGGDPCNCCWWDPTMPRADRQILRAWTAPLKTRSDCHGCQAAATTAEGSPAGPAAHEGVKHLHHCAGLAPMQRLVACAASHHIQPPAHACHAAARPRVLQHTHSTWWLQQDTSGVSVRVCTTKDHAAGCHVCAGGLFGPAACIMTGSAGAMGTNPSGTRHPLQARSQVRVLLLDAWPSWAAYCSSGCTQAAAGVP